VCGFAFHAFAARATDHPDVGATEGLGNKSAMYIRVTLRTLRVLDYIMTISFGYNLYCVLTCTAVVLTCILVVLTFTEVLLTCTVFVLTFTEVLLTCTVCFNLYCGSF
jgi:hypothetical protein